MKFSFEFRIYRRNLKLPLKMSRGTIATREGIVFKLVSQNDEISFSEAVVLPYFGTETLEQSIEYLQQLDGIIDSEKLDDIPNKLFATRFGLESGIWALSSAAQQLERTLLEVSYLLTSDRKNTVFDLNSALTQGYRTFKCKIGIGPFSEEKELVALLLEKLPNSSSLRLDANGGLELQVAREWMKLTENTAVEFIEQPLAPDKLDELLRLAEASSTPIAADESVATSRELQELSNLGWNGFFVVKPSRLGNLEQFLKWRNQSPRKIIYSSALETSIGTEIGLRLAATDSVNSRPIGYGVGQWFQEDSLFVHPKSPILEPGVHSLASLNGVFSNCSLP